MCDPVTLTVAATTTAAVAGGVSAYESYQQGSAQKKYYDELSRRSTNEAAYALDAADKQSRAVQDTAREEGKMLKEDQAAFNASVKAQLAAQGITGVSAEDIANSNFSRQKMDELMLRRNADVKSWEIMTSGKYQNWGLLNQAADQRYAGKMAKRKGKIDTITTLLGTASQVASMGAGFGGKTATPESAIRNTGYIYGRM